MSQPARQVVDRDVVHQQVAGIGVPEGVIRYVASGWNRAHLRGTSGRCLYPPVGRCPRGPDELVLPADVAEPQGTREGRMQFRVYGYDPGLAALALAHVEVGKIAIKRQVAGLERQRL